MSPCSSDHLILQLSRWRSGVWPLRILRTSIHSTSQLSDLSQPLRRQMLASLHETNHLGKALETRSLHRPQWVSFEERYDPSGQLVESPDAELLSITMIHGDLDRIRRTRVAVRGPKRPSRAGPRGTLEGPASRPSSWAADSHRRRSILLHRRSRTPIRDSGFPADYLHRSDCHSLLSTVGFIRRPSI